MISYSRLPGVHICLENPRIVLLLGDLVCSLPLPFETSYSIRGGANQISWLPGPRDVLDFRV